MMGLSFVRGIERREAFQLQDDFAVYHKICSILSDQLTFVINRS